LLSLDKTRKD
jgi:hypothetical protein